LKDLEQKVSTSKNVSNPLSTISFLLAKTGHQKENLVKAKKDAAPIGAMLRFPLPIEDKKN